jgi:urea transporter
VTTLPLRRMDGVMPRWSSWTQSRPVLDFLDYTLRGVGQVVFMNNPVTGLLILVGLWVAGAWLGLAATVGVLAATATAVLLGLDRDALRAGLFGFNGTLVGAGLATFLAPEFSVVVGAYVVLVAAASTVVTVALTRLLLPTVGLPPLTLPFNVVTLTFLLAAYSIASADPAPSTAPALPAPDSAVDTGVDLAGLAGGLFHGVGQVFLADNVVAGLLIVIGIAVCSRIGAGFALLGSAAGLGTALLLGGDGVAAQDGLWGYNAVLSAMAIGGVFSVLTWRSALLAVAAAVTASVVFVATGTALAPLGLPALTLPFCLATFAFLLLAGSSSHFDPVPATEVTTPEDHRRRLPNRDGAEQHLPGR